MIIFPFLMTKAGQIVDVLIIVAGIAAYSGLCVFETIFGDQED